MPTSEMDMLRSVLRLAVERFQDVRGQHRITPAPGSIAARQIEAQNEFASDREDQPVQDCLSVAALRLLAAADHVDSVSRLLQDPAKPYGHTAPARAALECAARAWWDLDPQIDTRERVVRGIIDRLESVIEASRIPVPAIQRLQEERITDLVEEAERRGFAVKRGKRQQLVSVGGVKVERAMVLLRGQLGNIGEFAYRALSAAGHGTLYALMSTTRLAVPTDDGGFVTPEVRVSSTATAVGVVIHGFFLAVRREIQVYGWDATDWHAFEVEARRDMARLLKSFPSPEEERVET